MSIGGIRRFGRKQALATWLALTLLAWQTVLATGAIMPPMSPLAAAENGIVICTEHGREIIPSDGGAPIRDSSDHSVSCPCCLPFSAHGGGAILADAAILAAPGWRASAFDAPDATAPPVTHLSPGPQQPRAPPVSV